MLLEELSLLGADIVAACTVTYRIHKQHPLEMHLHRAALVTETLATSSTMMLEITRNFCVMFVHVFFSDKIMIMIINSSMTV